MMSEQIPLNDLVPARPAARVPLDKAGPLESVVGWVARLMFGQVPDPVKVAFHHRRIMFGYLRLELAAMRWRKLPRTLHALAVMAAAQEIGCSWCMDFGYWENHHREVDADKLTQVPQWRASDIYTPLERAVMGYAVAATAQRGEEVVDDRSTYPWGSLRRAPQRSARRRLSGVGYCPGQ